MPCGTQDTPGPHQLMLHPSPPGSGWQGAMQLLLGHHWALWAWLSRGCLASPGNWNCHRATWGLLSCVAKSRAWWEEAVSTLIAVPGCPAAHCHGPAAGKTSGQGQLGTLCQLCAVLGSHDAGAPSLAPWPLPALPHCCPSSFGLRQLQWLPWFPSQPHGTLHLPPCPVLLLPLVSSPRWCPCQLWALLLPRAGGGALTCPDGDEQEPPSRQGAAGCVTPGLVGLPGQRGEGTLSCKPPATTFGWHHCPAAPPSSWSLSCPSSSLAAACPHALEPSVQGIPSWQDAAGQCPGITPGSAVC